MESVVYYRVHMLQILDTVLFRMNPIHTLIHFIIILPPRWSVSNVFFLSGIETKNFKAFIKSCLHAVWIVDLMVLVC